MVTVGSANANTDTVVLSGFKSDTMTILDIGGVLTQTDGSIIKLGGYYGDSSYSSGWVAGNRALYIKSKTALSSGLIYAIYAE